jgi:Transposase and inactivated derivatives
MKKFEFIYEHRSKFRIAKMCQALKVSRSGYYAFLKRPLSTRCKRRADLLTAVKEVFYHNHRIYGAPRVAAALPEDRKACVNTVARIMRENGLRSKTTKKYKATTNSKHSLPVADNLLNRDFTATHRNEKWVSDITYIKTDEGWLYLAALLDLYDHSIVGWSMDSRMKTQLVTSALKHAVARTRAFQGLLVHSDRGVQYASNRYQKLLKANGFICSMSRKGNCYDNAPMESFWGKLKQEWLYGIRFKTRAEAKKAIFEYIELFYNRRRLHTKNGFVAPLKVNDAA